MLKTEKNNIALSIICIVAILGGYSINGIKVFGVTITFYNVLIPLIFILSCGELYRYKENYNDSIYKKELISILVIFISWLVYGLILIYLNDFENLKNGIKELFLLGLAMLLILSMIILCNSENKIDIFFKTIKSIYILILIGAIVEMTTGIHLKTSKIYELSLIGNDEGLEYLATTIFYNVNDLSAFLAIGLMTFLYYKNKKELIVNSMVIFFSIAILLRNDAWIAMVSVILGLFLYLLLSCITNQKRQLKNGIIILGVVVLGYNLGKYILKALRALYIPIERLLFLNSSELNANVVTSKLKDTIVQQLTKDGTGGSGTARLDTYLTSIKNMFVETKGIGYGPSNFKNYLSSINTTDNLLNNPHGLWIEILVQYGCIVFIIIAIILLLIFIKLIKLYLNSKQPALLTIIVTDFVYVFASFAPSSFLGYTYQWLIISISVVGLNVYNIKKERRQKLSGQGL